MNLVNMGMKYLAPVVVTKLASMLGIKGPLATKLITAALPTIMAMVVGKAKSGGAGALMDMISSQPDTDPDSFASMLDTANPQDLARGGTDMMGGLFDSSTMSVLTGALGKFGGVSEDESKALLGSIAPAAFAPLKSQVQEQGLDASGLANLLDGQADNIAEAVPAEFAQQLQGTGLLDGVSPPQSSTPPTTPRPVDAPAPGGSSGGLMKWLIPLVAVAGLAWYFLGGTNDVSEIVPDADFTVGDVNVGDRFTSAVDSLKETVGGITDQASAEAAVPQLNEFNTELDQIGDLAGQLPEGAQGMFGGIVNTALESLRPMIEGAIENSGAGGILQPIADQMFEKLAALAGN